MELWKCFPLNNILRSSLPSCVPWEHSVACSFLWAVTGCAYIGLCADHFTRWSARALLTIENERGLLKGFIAS